MIGKPYSGKLNARFDQGELETGPRQVELRAIAKAVDKPPNPKAARAQALSRPHLLAWIAVNALSLLDQYFKIDYGLG